MTRGFVIVAQDMDDSVIYQECAETLAVSIRKVMPESNISVISNDQHDPMLWDKIIKFPYGDLAPDDGWKLINDWQVYEASPYDETIKLEADMYLPRSIDHWWDVLGQQDVVVSTTIRNFQNDISSVRMYRRFIDDNNLPDVYNAITYFKKSDVAKQFFEIVRDVFENWTEYMGILKCRSTEIATTDWAYAIACLLLGPEKTTMPAFTEMSMIHMKQYINGTLTEDWTDSLIYECLSDQIRIQTVPQLYPFHYHVKTFSDKIARCNR
jgi:hypothetical protein